MTAISPEAGSTLGGTTVTVTGTNFVAGATTVAFGSASGTSVSVTSATQLTVLSPPGASGLASVVVTTSGGSSASSTASQFDYTAPGGFARRKMRAAYGLSDAAAAQRELEALARHLDGIHPGAAASLREGLEETLTVQRLQLGPQLTRVLRSTNPIESMLSRGRSVARNVTRYRDGEMVLRWTAAGMTEARKSFRRIKGHRELGLLRAALRTHVEADVDQNRRIA